MRSLTTLICLAVLPMVAGAQGPKKEGPIEVIKIERKMPISYENDVEPIFIKHCTVCHSATEKKGKPFAGRTFWLYMLLYAISRYIIEIYRGDDRGVFFSTFSTSQLVSMAIVPISVFMLWRLRKTAA